MHFSANRIASFSCFSVTSLTPEVFHQCAFRGCLCHCYPKQIVPTRSCPFNSCDPPIHRLSTVCDTCLAPILTQLTEAAVAMWRAAFAFPFALDTSGSPRLQKLCRMISAHNSRFSRTGMSVRPKGVSEYSTRAHFRKNCAIDEPSASSSRN